MHALQAAGWTTFCQSQWLIVWKPPRGFPNISSTQNPQWWLARVCDMFFHLRNVPLILGSKRPGGFYQIGSETQKNIKKLYGLPMDSAVASCTWQLCWAHEFMRHMLRIDKGCAPMRSEGSSQFDSWIQFVRTYDDCIWLSLHTYCPTKEKQQKQVKQKLGTKKRLELFESTWHVRHWWCNDATLLSYGLWWVIIHYTWFPPMLNTNQDFLKYGFMIHEILFDSFSLNGLQWPGRYSESDFQHQTGTSSCRCPLKGGHQHPLGAGAKRGGIFVSYYTQLVELCHIRVLLIIP